MALVKIDSKGSRLDVSDDGGQTWQKVPGMQSHSQASGARSTQEVVSWDDIAQTTGEPSIGNFTVSAVLIPYHPVSELLREAAVDGDVLQFRYRSRRKSWYKKAVAGGGWFVFHCCEQRESHFHSRRRPKPFVADHWCWYVNDGCNYSGRCLPDR